MGVITQAVMVQADIDVVAAGNRTKVARVACMRKLLTMLNAIAKHGPT